MYSSLNKILVFYCVNLQFNFSFLSFFLSFFLSVPEHEFTTAPSVPDAHHQHHHQSSGLQVAGSSSHIGLKPSSQKPHMSSQVAGKTRKKKVTTKPKKIRNWNEKDYEDEDR